MGVFKDDFQRAWVVTIGDESLQRVRNATGFDLATMLTGEGLQELENDVVLFVDCIFAICEPAASANNVSKADFCQALRGDAIESAMNALRDAANDLKPGVKSALAKSRQESFENRVLARLGNMSAKDILLGTRACETTARAVTRVDL